MYSINLNYLVIQFGVVLCNYALLILVKLNQEDIMNNLRCNNPTLPNYFYIYYNVYYVYNHSYRNNKERIV